MIPNESLFIRLFLDEDVHKRAAEPLRAAGYDVISVAEAGRRGYSDEEQLEFAISQGRAIVTYNTGDFTLLHIAWLQAEKSHAGIILASQLDIGELVRRLRELLNDMQADYMVNQLLWL